MKIPYIHTTRIFQPDLSSSTFGHYASWSEANDADQNDDLMTFFEPFSCLELEWGASDDAPLDLMLCVHVPTKRLVKANDVTLALRSPSEFPEVVQMLPDIRRYKVRCVGRNCWELILTAANREARKHFRRIQKGEHEDWQDCVIFTGYFATRADFVRVLDCCPIPPPRGWCGEDVDIFEIRTGKLVRPKRASSNSYLSRSIFRHLKETNLEVTRDIDGTHHLQRLGESGALCGVVGTRVPMSSVDPDADFNNGFLIYCPACATPATEDVIAKLKAEEIKRAQDMGPNA